MKSNRETVPVRFHHSYPKLSFPRKRLEKITEAVYSAEKRPRHQILEVILCSDYRIRRLNARYRGKDRPTDVLSFALGDPDCLGEIYISLQRCAVDARRFGLTYDDEIERVFVHGLVHLLGFDHGPAMEAKERRYRSFNLE